MPNRESPTASSHSSALAFPSPAALSHADHAQRLENIERDVIARLADQSLDEILETRQNAKLLSETSWRIECACDAHAIAAAKNMRGRGPAGDTEGRGVMAAARRQAKKAGCTPSYIFKNAQIFKLIQQIESASPEKSTGLRILNERKYFVVALKAADPLAALDLFIEKKRTLSRFRTTDAERLLERQGLTKKSVSSAAVDAARQSIPELSTRVKEVEHINATIEMIREDVIPKCTNSEVVRIHESYIEELRDYMGEELFDQDAAVALRRAWRLGNHWESQLGKATKFPLDVIHREMRLLGSLGEFIQVPQAVGSTDIHWHKVGEPLPPELTGRKP